MSLPLIAISIGSAVFAGLTKEHEALLSVLGRHLRDFLNGLDNLHESCFSFLLMFFLMFVLLLFLFSCSSPSSASSSSVSEFFLLFFIFFPF